MIQENLLNYVFIKIGDKLKPSRTVSIDKHILLKNFPEHLSKVSGKIRDIEIILKIQLTYICPLKSPRSREKECPFAKNVVLIFHKPSLRTPIPALSLFPLAILCHTKNNI